MEPYYVNPVKKPPVSSQRIGIGLFAPIILWTLHLFTAYSLDALACAWGFFSFTLWGIAGMRIILLAITGVALIGLWFSGSIAYRDWRDLTKDAQESIQDPTEQYRFLTLSGVILSGFLTISMVWYTATILVNDLCVTG